MMMKGRIIMKKRTLENVSLILVFTMTVAILMALRDSRVFVVNAEIVRIDESYAVKASYNQSVGYKALLSDSYIYMDFDINQDIIYYRHYFDDNSTVVIGKVPNYIVSTGKTVIHGNRFYFHASVANEDPSVNDGFKNCFYSIDLESNRMRRIMSETNYLPAPYIYSFKEGIVSLYAKRNSSRILTSSIHILDIVNRQYTSKSRDYLLNENIQNGENIVNCCVSGDLIYALISTKSSDIDDNNTSVTNVSPVINVFNEEFDIVRTISLGEAQEIIMGSRVGTMEVFGDYIFMRNFSRHGIIGKIVDDVIEVLVYERDLDIAYGHNLTGSPIFFKRHTNWCYYIDDINDMVVKTNLNIQDGPILSMLATDSHSLIHLAPDTIDNNVYHVPNSVIKSSYQMETYSVKSKKNNDYVKNTIAKLMQLGLIKYVQSIKQSAICVSAGVKRAA